MVANRQLNLPAFLFALFFCGGICFGQTFSLPLQGYFHPGRAMPVACEFSGTGGFAEVGADGAITSRVAGTAGSRVMIPFLAFDPNARAPDMNLRALDDSDLLVGDAGDDPAAAAQIFPGKRIVSVHLDPVHPIEGSAMAWETLDGLLVTPIGLANIPQNLLREMTANGVTIVVLGGPAPAAGLPWRKQGGFWIAGGMENLPATVNPDAYAPTLQWVGGKSWALRRETVLLGALFGILSGGICLWRSRWAAVAAVGLAALCWSAAALNNRRYSPVTAAQGIIQFDIGQSWSVGDAWVYQRSHRDADFTLNISGTVHPIALQEAQWKEANLVLTCGPDGTPLAMQGRLKTDEPLALVMRRIAEGDVLAGGPVSSPMRLLMTPTLYGGFAIAGQRGPDQWGTDTAWTHLGTIVVRPIN